MVRRRSREQATEEFPLDDGPLNALSARSESDVPEPLKQTNGQNFIDENPNDNHNIDESDSSPDTIPPRDPKLQAEQAAAGSPPIKPTRKAAHPQEHQQEHQRDLQKDAEEPSSELQELDNKNRARKQEKTGKPRGETPNKEAPRDKSGHGKNTKNTKGDTKKGGKGTEAPKASGRTSQDDGRSARVGDSQKPENRAVVPSKGKGKVAATVDSPAQRNDQDPDAPPNPKGSKVKVPWAPASSTKAGPSRPKVADTAPPPPGPDIDLMGDANDAEESSLPIGNLAEGIDAAVENSDGVQAHQATQGQVQDSEADWEVDNMFHDIIIKAYQPREWLHFIGRNDYKIMDGQDTFKSDGHSDTGSLLHTIFRKINDTPERRYITGNVDYSNIRVRLNSGTDWTDMMSPNIFKPYSDLSSLCRKDNFKQMSFAELAREIKPLCHGIVRDAQYLFLDRYSNRSFIIEPTLDWSFVVLLVITVLSQRELFDALPGFKLTKSTHYRRLQDQVSDLLKYLRHNSAKGKYADWSTAKITGIWDRLQEKLQNEYSTADSAAVVGDGRVSREEILAAAERAAQKPGEKRPAALPVEEKGKKRRKD